MVTIRDSVRVYVQAFFVVCVTLTAGSAALAAQYASMVIDARSGEVLRSRNADTRLHPASLTKMMTLYVAFDAVERGEITLDTMVTVSKRAAAEPPSKLGLKSGQKIKLRYLIRAAAVKSANDAATAIGEAISGSEAAFARRMNRMAQALGMSRTTFKNAHGLTESGHLSTARDMTKLGRHLFYDFPDYYNLFSRQATSAGVKTVYNTNRKLLNAYRGADGIKTGYTRAAGYNLVASAERGDERIIVTVFGGRSTASRNAHVAELLDIGFDRAPSRVATSKPPKPYLTADALEGRMPTVVGKTVRVTGAVMTSPRPSGRPVPGQTAPSEGPRMVALQDGIKDALAEVAVASTVARSGEDAAPATDIASLAGRALRAAEGAGTPPAPAVLTASLAGAMLRPAPRPMEAMGSNADDDLDLPTVVTRVSTSGGKGWAINVGRFTTRAEAEKKLLQTALVEMSSLNSALRKVELSSKGWEAMFVGMSEAQADLACRRLVAQDVSCKPVGPS